MSRSYVWFGVMAYKKNQANFTINLIKISKLFYGLGNFLLVFLIPFFLSFFLPLKNLGEMGKLDLLVIGIKSKLQLCIKKKFNATFKREVKFSVKSSYTNL